MHAGTERPIFQSVKTLAEVVKAAGKARMAKLSPEERRELGRKGGRARWAKASDKDRAEAGRKMAAGRHRPTLRERIEELCEDQG